MKNNKISTDSYKKERVTKGIWYRIVSVLSAITVFCTTYALILPAITMEDPTLGVKINNKFEFESELLDIDFYVSGRAIFKDKDVDIENPVGDLVDLHVTVLDKENKAYEDYEAYAIENIGAKDVAQVTALKLKFTYMGHELDMSKCDVKAEINAKEVFFTDIIGSVPDDIYYTSTNHPMATPNDDILPLAKAVTVAQSTTTELAELPVVYTSDASEVSTLTVDVKGNSMAIASYAMEDYKFKVAYYTTVSELVKLEEDTQYLDSEANIGFNDRRKNPDAYYTWANTAANTGTGEKNWVYIPIALKPGSSAGAHMSQYEFMRQSKYVMLYKTVEYNFSEFYTLMSVNKLSDSPNYGNPVIYTGVNVNESIGVEEIETESGLPYEFFDLYNGNVLSYSQKKNPKEYNISLMFTDNQQSTNRLYIAKDSTLMLLYEPVSAPLTDDVTLIDYDISDGEIAKDGNATGIRTDDRGINSFYEKIWKGNNVDTTGEYIENSKFMFAEAWSWFRNIKSEKLYTKLSYGDLYLNENIRNWNLEMWDDGISWFRKNYAYKMVTEVDTSDGDFVPIFDPAISAPDLFSTENDFIPETVVTNDIASWYKLDKNNGNSWECSYGNYHLVLPNSGNSTVKEDCYFLAAGDYIDLPNRLTNTRGFTLEISFGDVDFTQAKDYATILMNSGFATGNKLNNTFNLYVEKRKSNANFDCLMINSIADVGANIKIASNAEELLRDSTLSITFDPDDSDMLRIYVNGVEIFNIAATGNMANFGSNNKLRLGTWAADRKISLEIKEIRMYTDDLRDTGVAQNAKYDGHYAPVIKNGLVAEYDADITNETGEKTTPTSWESTVSASPITFDDNVDYYFNGKGCVVTGTANADRIAIPDDVLNQIGNVFTIEIEFGNIKNAVERTNFIGTTQSMLDNADDEYNYAEGSQREFNIFTNSISNNLRLRFCLDYDFSSFELKKDETGNNLKYEINADTVSYSTLTVVCYGNKIDVFVNGVLVSTSTVAFTNKNGDNKISLAGLHFGPDKLGVTAEYRTIRLYSRALSQYEIVQNSRHDGTYNAGKQKYSGANLTEKSFGSIGKTVVGGRELEFNCIGETYILSSINVNSYNRDKSVNYNNFIYKDTGDLDIATYYGSQNLTGFSNFNWPLDETKTFNKDLDLPFHDFRFGDPETTSVGKYSYTGFGDRNFSTTANSNKLLKSRDEVNHNSYFGMKYKISFTLSKDYVGPLEYIFQGDDDLWVFLKDDSDPNDKGALAVDIGGIHAAMGQVVDLWNYIGDGNQRFADRQDDMEYTLYVFLLERGAVASTCYMEFTIPAISSLTEGTPTGSLQLAKQVENIVTSDEFKFEVKLVDAGGIPVRAEYTIYNEDGTSLQPVEFDTTATGGIINNISLQSGQMIRFDHLPIGTKYTIEEESNVFYHTSYKKNTNKIVDGNTVDGVIVDSVDTIIFYNAAGVELPSTGESGVVAYFIPFIVATAWMFTMPYMDKTNKWRAKGRKREE